MEGQPGQVAQWAVEVGFSEWRTEGQRETHGGGSKLHKIGNSPPSQASTVPGRAPRDQGSTWQPRTRAHPPWALQKVPVGPSPGDRRALGTYVRGSSEEGLTGAEHPWQAEGAKETLQMGVAGQEDRWALVGGRKGRQRHPPGLRVWVRSGERPGETLWGAPWKDTLSSHPRGSPIFTGSSRLSLQLGGREELG